MKVRMANAPCSWGVYRNGDPENAPWMRVMDEVAATGYGGLELGPYGYFPCEPGRLRDELTRRKLTLVAGSALEPFHVAGEAAGIRERTKRTCALIAAMGAKFLVVLPNSPEERVRVAGRSDLAKRLEPGQWSVYIDSIRDCARIAYEEHGLVGVLHPHAASYLEFQDEIDRAIEELDPRAVGLCLDTGHCAYAGVDPVALYRKHAARTPYLHFKNVDPVKLRHAVDNVVDLHAAVRDGVFCPLDRGAVDFVALKAELERTGYDGWATVEQDSDPRSGGDPTADARASLRFVQSIGLA